MLPRTAYFEALARLGNKQSPEWHATVAGLVVLRLVDDWLDNDSQTLATHDADLHVIRALIAEVPQAHLLKTLLNKIVQTVAEPQSTPIHAVAPPLLAYARMLELDAKFTLAYDVLLPLRIRAEQDKAFTVTISTALRLAYVSRAACQFDVAQYNYDLATHYAKRIDDQSSVLIARGGIAKIHIAGGNVSYAQSTLADATTAATRLGDTRVLSYMYQDQAMLELLFERWDRAIPLLYRALECTLDHSDQITADLSIAFLGQGNLEKSRRLSAMLALTSQQQIVRWSATHTLMRIAILERQETPFVLYHTMLDLVPLPPWAALQYQIDVAQGYRAFGKVMKMQTALHTARTITTEHQIYRDFAPEADDYDAR